MVKELDYNVYQLLTRGFHERTISKDKNMRPL